MPGKPQPALTLTGASLASAVGIPIVYFGTQLAAAPFYPGYSFSRDLASMLGTAHSRAPWIFNGGIMLTGLAVGGASFGLYRSFRLENGRLLSSLIALSLAWSGTMSIKAGIFPIPDPRHDSPGGFWVLSAPFLMLFGVWKKDSPLGLRLYLSLSALLLAPIIVVLRGKLAVPGLGSGTLQRLLAVAFYLPMAVVGAYFLRKGRHRLE